MASTVLSGAKSGTSRIQLNRGIDVSPATLYTNNTTQNVRIVINYMEALQLTVEERQQVATITINQGDTLNAPPPTHYPMILTLAGVSVRANLHSIGRNIAFFEKILVTAGGETIFQYSTAGAVQQPYTTAPSTASVAITANNAGGGDGSLPTEIMLAPNQSFGAACGVYNIIVIPENG